MGGKASNSLITVGISLVFALIVLCGVVIGVQARATYREQGFDDLLLKPISLDKMRECLSRNLSISELPCTG